MQKSLTLILLFLQPLRSLTTTLTWPDLVSLPAPCLQLTHQLSLFPHCLTLSYCVCNSPTNCPSSHLVWPCLIVSVTPSWCPNYQPYIGWLPGTLYDSVTLASYINLFSRDIKRYLRSRMIYGINSQLALCSWPEAIPHDGWPSVETWVEVAVLFREINQQRQTQHLAMYRVR